MIISDFCAEEGNRQALPVYHIRLGHISLTTSLASQSALEKSFVAHRRLLHNF